MPNAAERYTPQRITFDYPPHPWATRPRAVREVLDDAGRWVPETDAHALPYEHPHPSTDGKDRKMIALGVDGAIVSVQPYHGPGRYTMTCPDGTVLVWLATGRDTGRYRIAGQTALEPGTWEPEGYPVWSGQDEDYEAWADAFEAHNERVQRAIEARRGARTLLLNPAA